MRIVQFATDGGMAAVGYLEGERVVDFTRAFRMFCVVHGYPVLADPWSLAAMIEAGLFDRDLFAEVRQFIEDHGLTGELTVAAPRLKAPISRPRRIIALGLNYAAHAAESGRKPPKDPIFFLKSPTAVIGPEEQVVIPRGVGRVDPEVELAVVIGKGGRRIPRTRAREHIAGYTIMNDVTARDLQRQAMDAANPWFMSKSFDTFAPLGPCVLLPEDPAEPCELDLRLRVNGEVRQQSNTRDLIFTIPELIARFSRYVSLEAGDIIATGTPSGIAPIHPGDVMEAEIERIGVLRNPVVGSG